MRQLSRYQSQVHYDTKAKYIEKVNKTFEICNFFYFLYYCVENLRSQREYNFDKHGHPTCFPPVRMKGKRVFASRHKVSIKQCADGECEATT